MAYQYTDCKFVDIKNESDVVKRYFIKFPDEINFTFKPGQFVMLDLPIPAKYTNRAYSIASPPGNDNIFELAIVLNPEGKGTPFLFQNAEIGSTVKVSKALGKFTLPDPIDHDLCFICTGTGIAPLRSMLLHIYNKDIPHKNIYMIFGNRWEKDILYRKEMEDLAERNPEFKFIPVLSRKNDGWIGRTGYVHPVYEELFSDKRPATFFICGWKDMLNEARERIATMGYDKKQIRFESYD
ncbi:MAG: oxidoreductase [Bacteroidetes bacterium]|nr:MAG: oxidoreductase [Bacteroidota bacterium]REK07629.1 MAG: oxidoreductase [Bacteroidota bacterium]REK31793.1 MAG: oxidoreductase [Bacteroidota bacterium]REK50150.1 MAG: oxidoreductase [Bacteroidota bacterium]